MIQTRVLVGSILALAAAGVLFADWYLPPWFPCLFCCLMVAGVLASRELVRLFPGAYRPSELLVSIAVLLCLAANWYPTCKNEFDPGTTRGQFPQIYAFVAVLFTFIASMIAAFLVEMNRFREPGTAVARLGATLLVICYLGVLPCCFAQIRFLHPDRAGLLLALT